MIIIMIKNNIFLMNPSSSCGYALGLCGEAVPVSKHKIWFGAKIVKFIFILLPITPMYLPYVLG